MRACAKESGAIGFICGRQTAHWLTVVLHRKHRRSVRISFVHSPAPTQATQINFPLTNRTAASFPPPVVPATRAGLCSVQLVGGGRPDAKRKMWCGGQKKAKLVSPFPSSIIAPPHHRAFAPIHSFSSPRDLLTTFPWNLWIKNPSPFIPLSILLNRSWKMCETLRRDQFLAFLQNFFFAG